MEARDRRGFSEKAATFGTNFYPRYTSFRPFFLSSLFIRALTNALSWRTSLVLAVAQIKEEEAKTLGVTSIVSYNSRYIWSTCEIRTHIHNGTENGTSLTWITFYEASEARVEIVSQSFPSSIHCVERERLYNL